MEERVTSLIQSVKPPTPKTNGPTYPRNMEEYEIQKKIAEARRKKKMEELALSKKRKEELVQTSQNSSKDSIANEENEKLEQESDDDDIEEVPWPGSDISPPFGQNKLELQKELQNELPTNDFLLYHLNKAIEGLEQEVEEKKEEVSSIEHMVSIPVGTSLDQYDFSWIVPIEVMLGSLFHGEVQACSISNVSNKLREVKEDAFKPKHISIGPIHREATRHLQLMEEPKWHYMREFLGRQGTLPNQNRSSEDRLKDCSIDIHRLHKVICASYSGSINNMEATNPHEIAKIMIVDGCFLLELLIRLGDYIENQEKTYDNDLIFKPKKKLLSVLNDVAMLENQIPFIVLKKLYRKVFPDGSDIKDDHRVSDIVRKAFGYPFMNRAGGVHVLHLMHLSTVEQYQKDVGKKAKVELLCCATRLRASGVIIRPKLNRTNQHQNKLLDIFDFDISFNELGELEISPLYIKGTTEVRWRNLIAWEQSKIWNKCKYTSYALFFKGLICCEHDIELLKKNGVIVSDLKKLSNKDLLTLFHTISKGADNMDLSYCDTCERLNVYEDNGMKFTKIIRKLPIIYWHKCRKTFDIIVYYGRNWYNILIRDHIPTVWKFIGIVAAALLLVLTIMQTYYSSQSF